MYMILQYMKVSCARAGVQVRDWSVLHGLGLGSG